MGKKQERRKVEERKKYRYREKGEEGRQAGMRGGQEKSVTWSLKSKYFNIFAKCKIAYLFISIPKEIKRIS